MKDDKNKNKIDLINIDDAEVLKTSEGIMKPLVFGENISSIYFEIPPNLEVPAHSHPKEMIMFCIEGNFKVTVNGEERNVKSGDAILIPYDAEIGIKNSTTTAKTIISSHPSSAESRQAFINKMKKFQKNE